MRTNLRKQLLATTLLVGAFAPSAAYAQDTQSTVPDQNQPTNPVAAPPTGPVEAQPTPSVSSTGQAVQQPQEIIVTGSRIPQPNLESAAPVTVVNNQDIKLSGSSRIEDVLGQLPSAAATQNGGLANSATGTAEIDLRYLGAKRSVTLVNGRRLVPGDPNGTTQAADINIIPTSIVKRVEVLTGGASSVYGADAVAGVVNFIIDTDFSGIRFDGNYSIFQHNQHNPGLGPSGLHVDDILNAKNFAIPGDKWDGQSFDGTITIGSGFDDGRGHAMAYFGYRKVHPVLGAARDYSACTITNSNATGRPQCGGSATAFPGNIFFFPSSGLTTSTTGALGPGTIAVGGPANIFNYGPLNHFQRPDERYTAGAFANYEINDAIKPYLEFMFMDDRTLAQIAPSGDFFNTTSFNCPNATTGLGGNPLMSASQLAAICAPSNLVSGFIGNFPVAVGAPYNTVANGVGSTTPINFVDPITGATYNRGFGFLARRNVEGGNRIADLKHTTFRGVLGSRGDLSNVFSYDGYFQYGRVNYEQVYENEFSASRLARALDVVDNPNTPGVVDPVCRSVLTGDDPNCVPYDVFGPNGPSEAALNYLNVSGLITGQTSEDIGHFDITGSLGEAGVKLPWAEDGVGINLGVEYRREALELHPDALFQAGDLTGQGAPTLPVNGNFRVWEGFVETQIPIIQHSFIDEFTIGAGYRHSWYELKGGRKYDTDTWKIQAELAPIRDIRFRGSYNRAVRAPNIAELFSPQFIGLDGSKDPCAGHPIDPATNPGDYGCVYSGMTIGQGTPANPAGQYNGQLGGVPTLNPEIAKTYTLGVVLQPRFIPRFAFTVDYWNIKLDDAIQGYGADAIVTACSTQSTATFRSPACDLVHRAPGTGSIWLTPTGYVIDTPNNNGQVKTDGLDFNAAYNHRLGSIGTLSLSFNGTYQLHYKVDNGLTEPYDCSGLFGPVCSGFAIASSSPMPKWRHKARLGLDLPFGLGLSVQWRMLSKVDAETLENNETLAGANNFEPTLHVPARHYFDLAATYSLFNRVNLRAGVNNIFDKDPPLFTTGGSVSEGSNLCPTASCSNNTYPGVWDTLGRQFWVGATIDFKPARAPAPLPPPPAPPPPPPAPPATITCPDGLVILANQQCPAPPPPPPPPAPAPERGH